MTNRSRLAFSIVVAGLVIFASPLKAEEKAATDSSAPKAEDLSAPSPEKKGQVTKAYKKKADGVRAQEQAFRYWFCVRDCTGAFHMFGNLGRAILKYPPQGGTPYDSNFTFVDDLPVGGRTGWTYKAVGVFPFHIFLSKMPSSNGKYRLLYSWDNETFDPFGYADISLK